MLALVLSLVVASASPALAAPLVVQRDRADNGFSFTYDAEEDEIVDAASSLRLDSRDPVSFIVSVSETPDPESGKEPLRGRISLGLSKDRVVRYEGLFTLEITNSEGEVAFTESQERKIVLRPKRGQRKASMSFFFDLPSGGYDVTAYFERTEG